MANDLLASFKAVSQAHSHIVFNERTQEFERAGKRHAIASFSDLPTPVRRTISRCRR